MYWVDFQLAQRKGLKFYQTRSIAIIVYHTLPAYCISKVVVMKSEEIIYQKIYVSPRPPPKISYKDNWMCDLDSEVAGSSKDTQRIQPKPKTQLSRTVRPVGEQPFTQEIEKDVLFGREGTKNSTRTERPVGGQQSTTVEELDIDFIVPGLSHADGKEAEHFRVQELVKKSKVILIEKHFKPTCSITTSTTHSATIRRR